MHVRELPALPDGLRSLTSLGAAAGYTDTFVVDVPAGQRSAEAWARRVLEEAPGPLRASLPRGWARLGLRHGPIGSPDHVLGWPIRERTEDHLLVGAESSLGMASCCSPAGTVRSCSPP